MSMHDLDQVSAEWRARGFSCDIWTDPPGQVWADFVHAVDELVIPIEGEVEIEMQGRKLRPCFFRVQGDHSTKLIPCCA